MKKTTDGAESSQVESTKIPNENLETSLGNSKPEPAPEITYSPKNSELDQILGEATTTVEETRAKESDAKQKVSLDKPMSAEDAAGMAVSGLLGIVEFVGENTGKNIQLPEKSVMLFAALTAPLIQKYGAKLKIDPNNIDLDSWMPELMALGGAAVIGWPMYNQLSKVEKVVVDGDKSESGT